MDEKSEECHSMKLKIKDANTHINRMSGYGKLSGAIASGLHGLGHDVYYDYITGCDDATLDMLARKKFEHTDDTIYLWIRPPHYIKGEDFNEKYKNIFFTMHESETFDGWKADWIELLNKLTAIITPTHWNKNVFLNNGLKVPVYVVPLGVNKHQFKMFPEDTFNVLCVHDALGSDASRENWKETIEAFSEVFGENQQAKLTIKTWNMKQEKYDEFMKAIKGRVYATTTNLTNADMADLYKRSTVFIKNSNKEGWSLPLTEAMACGLAVIVRKCQVLVENVGEYKQVSWFTKKDQLKWYLNEAYKEWCEKKAQADVFSWKRTVEGVEKVLYGIK